MTMEKTRPTIITILCVYMTLGAIFNIPFIFSNAVRDVGVWYQSFMVLAVSGGIVAIIGLWKMKKWAVVFYVFMYLVANVVQWAMGIWNIYAAFYPALGIAIMFSQYTKMD
jgi:hypothetical protein